MIIVRNNFFNFFVKSNESWKDLTMKTQPFLRYQSSQTSKTACNLTT